jgi:hypothetical protein
MRKTTLSLGAEEVSHLLGLVRFGRDEAEEHLGLKDGRDIAEKPEEFAWWLERAEVLVGLADRLEAAASRLGLEV